MEVNIADILKNEGFKKDFYFFEDIQNRDIQFYGEKIRITEPVKVQGYAVNYEGKIRVCINIRTKILRTCSRCLGSFYEEADYDAEYVFVKTSEKPDEDVYLIKGDTISLDSIVIDEIASQMTMKPLCKTDCKGLCPKCGKNKNIHDCNCKFEEVDPRLQILSSFLEK
ncbi:YceD family protein [Lutispora thermophila]|uniref:DUF177 domain-containing protein n=1 Tax=Lutispora thermophila DSM 19022 TaxID=1122184 RepID=A0A1M6G461_9FIRM|nr:DUF177 domain-containing protein [Lutispora thermophila]SHJ04795.1 uncharacterized protein SAMN02745176_02220 [Lutispora thermophila DSM 19022]